MINRIAVVAAMAAILAVAGQAGAESRFQRTAKRLELEMKQCIGRAAGRASGQSEATRDTVADFAARQCEANYVKKTTQAKIMEPAQARVEVNMAAYQLAERVLSH
jgi:hypothetical protein